MKDQVNGGDDDESTKKYHDWGQGRKEVRYFIETLTNPGDLVLDPFGGGGTIPVECKRVGRRCITAEIDARYAAVIRARLADTDSES